MKFNKIKIPESTTKSKGISEINIQRLNNVVAFVGKNGSGKSRILDLIETNLFKTIEIYMLLNNSISFPPKQLGSLISILDKYKEYFLLQEKVNYLTKQISKDPSNQNFKKELTETNTKLIQTPRPSNNDQLNNLLNLRNILERNYLRRINNEDIRKLQQAIVKNPADNFISFENLIESNTNATFDYDEFKTINRSALIYLSKLPNKLTYDYFDCLGDESKYQTRISYKRYLALKKFVKDFLNKDLTWERRKINHSETENGIQSTSSGFWKLNNREFNYTEFSEGEKTLFTYALLFFLLDQNPKLNIRESIILIDEPELHLHPDSEIDLINGIRNVIGETGQLIIATHSINILSTLNYDEIFMVKDGVIKHPTQSTPGESLSELMSIQERVDKLIDFMNSVSIWTFVNFMAQCFSEPEAIQSSRENDPQIDAFKNAIKNNLNKQSAMLLDFGAGKGRVYERIKSDHNFINKINYSALEPREEYHSEINKQGATLIYKSYKEIPENTFDFVLLCNVLHEIPLDEWEENLNKIIKSLKTNGYLIIIESEVLNKGEKIGEIGYLILNIEELQKLFNLKELPLSINGHEKEGITCGVINKSDLTEVTKDSIYNCLNELDKNTLKKIESLRKEEHLSNEIYGVGRKSAFLSQQNINARLGKKYIQKEIDASLNGIDSKVSKEILKSTILNKEEEKN